MMFWPEQTITEVARIEPAAIDVFEEAEIDFSCKGAQSLADAALKSGYRVEDIIRRLENVPPRPKNWFRETLSSLMACLMSDHDHTTSLRLPAIRHAIATAAALPNPEVSRIAILFEMLAEDMTHHVLKEELELFPHIRDLERAGEGPAPVMRIAQRVLRELIEHEFYRDTLDKMAILADRLPSTPAADELRAQIRLFRREVHEHMHLENNVLYPRAIEIENTLRARAHAVGP